jgi:hypothetical protein
MERLGLPCANSSWKPWNQTYWQTDANPANKSKNLSNASKKVQYLGFMVTKVEDLPQND